MSLRQVASIGCLVLNTCCGELAKPLMEDVDKHLSHCGVAWTCARLKAVYTAALNLVDGRDTIAREIYQKNSISYNKETLLPKGPWGTLVKRLLEAERPSVQKRVIACLRLYTSFRLEPGTYTKQQVEKALSSIQHPSPSFEENLCSERFSWFRPVNPGSLADSPVNCQPLPWIPPDGERISECDLDSYTFHICNGDRLLVTRLESPGDIAYYAEQCFMSRVKAAKVRPKPREKFEYDARNLRACSSYYSPHRIPTTKWAVGPDGEFIRNKGKRVKEDVDIAFQPYASMVNSLCTTEWVPSSIDMQTPCYEMRQELRETFRDQFVGEIIGIQEQGGKWRVAAKPSAWIQFACEPYHTELANICNRAFPYECNTEDQVSGAYAMQALLLDGGSPISTDLSSATDTLPREIPMRIVNALGYPEFSQAIDDISRAAWKCEFHPKGEIHYETGQPMGVYGSFPMLSITNLALCELSVRLAESQRLENIWALGAWEEQLTDREISEVRPLRSFRHGEYYHVVGDDVVQSDPRIARVYRDLCSKLDVPLSLNKCFEGNRVAEFAGFLALRTNRCHSEKTNLFRPYKVPSERYVTNPLQFLDSLGIAVTRQPRRKSYWTKMFNAYWKTVDRRSADLSPLVSQREDGPIVMANKACAKDLVALGNAIALAQIDAKGLEWTRQNYPTCLAPNSRINSKPLIPEGGPWDHYGFDPKTFIRKRDDRPKDWSAVRESLTHDPLLQDALTSQCQLLDNCLEESESTNDMSDLGYSDCGTGSDVKTEPSPIKFEQPQRKSDVGPDLD